MTQIAEAYLHLKQIRVTPSQLGRLGDLASKLATEVGLNHFPADSVVEVRLTEGSLKGWISVGGALLGIYGAVANYSGFKQSVGEIVKDSRAFSDEMIKRFLSEDEVAAVRVYRTERRTKVPGRLKRLIERREWLEVHRLQLRAQEVESEEVEIERRLQEILSEIDPAERSAVRTLLGERVPAFPRPIVPRSALPQRRAQYLMIDTEQHDLSHSSPDYLNRFRLIDGPSATSNGFRGVDGRHVLRK